MTEVHGPADAAAPEGAPAYDTIVAGAGVAGLTVANELAGRGYRVLVLEASARLGGVASPLEVDGLVLDGGAESFATRGGAVAELATELGLGDDIVAPNLAGAWLQLPDRERSTRAVPLPKATLLGIPSVPLAQDVIDVLGWGGALRAYADRLMPVLRIGKDDALGPLVRRRMGQRVLDRLVAPLAGGVYSADTALLDIATVAPGLNNALTQAGSLSGAVAVVLEERAAGAGAGSAATGHAATGDAAIAGAATGRAGSAVQSIRGGIHRITAALADRAREHRAVLRTGVRVESAAKTATGWLVTTDAGSFAASSLVVALPEREARRVLAEVDGFVPAPLAHSRDARPLREQRARASAAPSAPSAPRDAAGDQGHGVTVELVTLVFPPGAIEGDPRGTGVLVAADVTGVRAKAMTHATAKWPWLREAAAGREIVRLSYGSGTAAPATEGLDAAAAAELALADARVLLGIDLPQPVASARVRWEQGQPSSVVGARARQQALRAAAAQHDTLLVVGAAVAGTGLAQVVPDARRASLEIRRERFAVPGTPWSADLDAETRAHDDQQASEGPEAPGGAAGIDADPIDTGRIDTGRIDTGRIDADPTDAGRTDAGHRDPEHTETGQAAGAMSADESRGDA